MIYLNLLFIPFNTYLACKTDGFVMWINLIAVALNVIVVGRHIELG